MKLLFGEFGTFGDVLKSRMVILVHKTNAAAKRQDKRPLECAASFCSGQMTCQKQAFY
ncbi:unnamed protein product [Brassica rapa subsp. trilocularis]